MAKNDIDGVAEFRVRRSKRKIQLTPKALQNAIEAKWRDILRSRGKLLIEKLWAELERRFGSAATIREVVKTTTLEQDPSIYKIAGCVCLYPPCLTSKDGVFIA